MYNKKAVASFFMDTIKEQVAKRQAEGQFIKIPNLMGMVINKNDDTNDTEKVYDVEVAPVGEVLSIPTDEECGEPRALGTDMVTLVMKIEGGIKTALSSVAKDKTNNLNNMTSVAVDFFIKGLRQHYIRFDKTPSTLNRSNKKNCVVVRRLVRVLMSMQSLRGVFCGSGSNALAHPFIAQQIFSLLPPPGPLPP